MLDRHAYGRALAPLLDRSAAYARSRLGNRQDAEDAVQQAALQAWARIHQYDPARPFNGWWFAILRNCCIDLSRRRRAAGIVALDGIEPPLRAQEEPFDWTRLEQGLRSLSEDHEEVLRLRYYGGLTYDALADTLGIPKGTVMSRLHHARKALAERLNAEAK